MEGGRATRYSKIVGFKTVLDQSENDGSLIVVSDWSVFSERIMFRPYKVGIIIDRFYNAPRFYDVS